MIFLFQHLFQKMHSRFNRKKILFIYILLELKFISKQVELPNFPPA